MSVPPAGTTAEQESLSERAARSIKHPLARTLLVLTFTTGLVDATSYLGLGHVFAANMTGNIVFLGFGIPAAAVYLSSPRSFRSRLSSSAQAQVASSLGRRRTAILDTSLGRWPSRCR